MPHDFIHVGDATRDRPRGVRDVGWMTLEVEIDAFRADSMRIRHSHRSIGVQVSRRLVRERPIGRCGIDGDLFESDFRGDWGRRVSSRRGRRM